MAEMEPAEVRGCILVVDDDPEFGELVKLALEGAGFTVEGTTDARLALEMVRKGSYDLVISDLRMPEMDGVQLLNRIKEHDPGIGVLMLTGYPSLESAVTCIKLGAENYLTKPFKTDHLREVVRKMMARRGSAGDNGFSRIVRSSYGREVVLGESQAMRAVFDLALKVAGNNSNLLIMGESGTGKEVVARFIHLHSPRAGRPFVTVNCAAIPENLLESELFGHRKGAFTGATYTKRGSFELADGGTLFLDEIAEMRPEMQAKILRVLEDSRVKKVGSEEAQEVDVRLVAATNKNLSEEMTAGRFREDLYYRLNVVQIVLPPLCRHREDIVPLARHFLVQYCREVKKSVGDFSPDALDFLTRYSWPGNIRELKNAIERAVIFVGPDGLVRTRHFPQYMVREAQERGRGARDLKALPSLREAEFRYIREVLELCHGNRTRAAEILGISPVTLWRKLSKEEAGTA